LGLAKFSAKPSLQTIDHGDAVFGSIFFMAPEQFERTALDQRTDMYSLGAMFYFTLSGSYPFDGESAPQVMASHLQGSVTPLHEIRPDLPIWLCEWVMWHIRRNMDHRPASARDALAKFLADETYASQAAMGMTQAIPTIPANNLINPNTAAQPINPLLITGAVPNYATNHPVSAATAPQPILTPDGQPSSHTSAQSIHSAAAQTSAQAIQAAMPDVQANQQLIGSHVTPDLSQNLHAHQNKGMSGTSKAMIIGFIVAGIGILVAGIVIGSSML